MKKIAAIAATTALIAGVGIATASPASAYTGKENRVWAAVRSFAPEGAAIMGKKDSVTAAKVACRSLRNGAYAEDLAASAVEAAVQSDLSGKEADIFLRWVAATTVAGATFLCPEQGWKFD